MQRKTAHPEPSQSYRFKLLWLPPAFEGSFVGSV
jgi:hypothetical protein